MFLGKSKLAAALLWLWWTFVKACQDPLHTVFGFPLTIWRGETFYIYLDRGDVGYVDFHLVYMDGSVGNITLYWIKITLGTDKSWYLPTIAFFRSSQLLYHYKSAGYLGELWVTGIAGLWHLESGIWSLDESKVAAAWSLCSSCSLAGGVGEAKVGQQLPHLGFKYCHQEEIK